MIESMRDAGRRTSDAREQYLADIKESQENLRKAFEKHEQAERERKTRRAESRNSETSP